MPTIKIAKPATVMRAFKLAATIAAARMVVQAATVLNIVSSSMSFPKQRLPDWHGQPCSPASLLAYAALRFTLFSAIEFSLLSVAFSSSRFCCRTEAQSLRPSLFAQAISVP